MKPWALLFPVILLFLVGCPAVDTKELNFTRKKPENADLVGTWTPNSDTLKEIRTRGHYPQAQHEIVLRADGTFSIRNMPDWWTNGFGESGRTFSSFDGRWDLEEGKDGWTIWEIALRTPTFGTSINVYQQKPPYSLFIRVGDPNNADAMIFDRTSTNDTKPNPQGGANGRQPIRSETNAASAAAASLRSP